jgi:ATP/maltotriose-dependent transcriptional regulator MalT
MLARDTYLNAISSAMFAGRLGTGPDEREIAERARAFVRPTPQTVADLLLDGLVKRFTEGYAASVAPLTRGLRRLAEVDDIGEDQRWLWLACRLAQELWDEDLWQALATRGARIGRECGRLSLLANSMNHLAAFHVHSGALATAGVQIDEVDVIEQATGLPPLKYSACMLAATRGDRAQMQVLWNTVLQNAAARGEGVALGMYWCLSARVHNGHGQYDKALADARRACERDDMITYGWALAEWVEAGIRAGSLDDAAGAFDRLTERTRSGTEWALGVEARCRGLLNDDEAAYYESTERLARSHAAVELARSQLCYGEWLRRMNRRSDAREPLRAAHESFGRMGAEAFAERARRELLATGETVRKRTGNTVEALTPQEVHVATMARDGRTNPEIGERLFISPRTVEYHLHKVFRKLGIAGRRDLHVALAERSHHGSVGFN